MATGALSKTARALQEALAEKKRLLKTDDKFAKVKFLKEDKLVSIRVRDNPNEIYGNISPAILTAYVDFTLNSAKQYRFIDPKAQFPDPSHIFKLVDGNFEINIARVPVGHGHYILKANTSIAGAPVIATEVSHLTLLRGKENVIQIVPGGGYDQTKQKVFVYIKFARLSDLHAALWCSEGIPTETSAYALFCGLKAKNQGFSLDTVHRDVKPSNLLIEEDGTIRFGDYGCATTQMEGELRSTMTGTEPEGNQFVRHEVDVEQLIEDADVAYVKKTRMTRANNKQQEQIKKNWEAAVDFLFQAEQYDRELIELKGLVASILFSMGYYSAEFIIKFEECYKFKNDPTSIISAEELRDVEIIDPIKYRVLMTCFDLMRGGQLAKDAAKACLEQDMSFILAAHLSWTGRLKSDGYYNKLWVLSLSVEQLEFFLIDVLHIGTAMGITNQAELCNAVHTNDIRNPDTYPGYVKLPVAMKRILNEACEAVQQQRALQKHRDYYTSFPQFTLMGFLESINLLPFGLFLRRWYIFSESLTEMVHLFDVVAAAKSLRELLEDPRLVTALGTCRRPGRDEYKRIHAAALTLKEKFEAAQSDKYAADQKKIEAARKAAKANKKKLEEETKERVARANAANPDRGTKSVVKSRQ